MRLWTRANYGANSSTVEEHPKNKHALVVMLPTPRGAIVMRIPVRVE